MIINRQSYLVVGPSLKMGGMERASVNLANSLVSQGHECIYISLFNQDRFFSIDKRVKFIEPNFNYKKLDVIRSVKWLRSIFRNYPIKNIIVFNKFYSAIVLLSSLGLSKRVLISERSSPFYKQGFLVDLFSVLIFYFIKPNGILSQTKIAAEHQKKYYGENIPMLVMPNVLRDIKKGKSKNRGKTILAVGRLNDDLKGFDRLIEAFHLIKNSDWVLNFAGGESENSIHNRQIEKYKLEKRINFLGKLSSDNLDSVYSESGIFVIPSRSEGFPNALCEAMASGVPSIAFDFIAGPRDIITDGFDGIIVEDNNINELANAIDDLIINKSKREFLSNNAAQIKTKFSNKTIIDNLVNFTLTC